MSNSNLPPEVLAQLAEDKKWRVRGYVARNSLTPPETLTQLAEDENVGVRKHVATNPNTPPEALTKLAEDENNVVRYTTKRNPTYLQHRAVQDGVCEMGQQIPVEWLKEMYLT